MANKANLKKAFIFGFIACVLLYAYAALQFWRGIADFITVATLGKGLILYFYMSWGKYETDLIFGENTFLVICALIFVFDYLVISGILYLGFFVWEKIKTR